MLLVLFSASLLHAQDEPKPEHLRKMYEDALANLKAAQDRKNDLALENEKLRAKLATMQQELDKARNELAEHAEKTFFLRAHYAAWQAFIAHYPLLAARWRSFLETDYLGSTPRSPDFMDPHWPLSALE